MRPPDDAAITEVENVNQRQDAGLNHRIDIECTHCTSTGARYRVTYQGETLVESARDPEYEACRALLARGIVGRLVTYGPGSAMPRMKIDIAEGAKLRTVDSHNRGPRTGPYRPHPERVDPSEPE